MNILTLKTPLTFQSTHDNYVRVLIGDSYSWCPCVIREEDLPRVRDWFTQTIIERATWDYAQGQEPEKN